MKRIIIETNTSTNPIRRLRQGLGRAASGLVSFGLTIGQVTIACLMPVVGFCGGPFPSSEEYWYGWVGSSVARLWLAGRRCPQAHVAGFADTLLHQCMFGYMANQTCAMAYLPELTDDDDVLASINGRARVKEMSCMLLYMIVVAASQLLLNLDAVDTGQGGFTSISCSRWHCYIDELAVFHGTSRVARLTRKRKLIVARASSIYERPHQHILRRRLDLLKFLVSPTRSPRPAREVSSAWWPFILIEQLEMCGYVAVLVCAIVFTVPGAALSSKRPKGAGRKQRTPAV